MNKQTSYICSVVYYAAVKSHALLICAIPWMNLKIITWSKRKQIKKGMYCMSPMQAAGWWPGLVGKEGPSH